MDTKQAKIDTEKFNELVSLWIYNRPLYNQEIDALEDSGLVNVAVYAFLASMGVLSQRDGLSLQEYWKIIMMQYALVESGLDD